MPGCESNGISTRGQPRLRLNHPADATLRSDGSSENRISPNSPHFRPTIGQLPIDLRLPSAFTQDRLFGDHHRALHQVGTDSTGSNLDIRHFGTEETRCRNRVFELGPKRLLISIQSTPPPGSTSPVWVQCASEKRVGSCSEEFGRDPKDWVPKAGVHRPRRSNHRLRKRSR
jgi:hypothetical protein